LIRFYDSLHFDGMQIDCPPSLRSRCLFVCDRANPACQDSRRPSEKGSCSVGKPATYRELKGNSSICQRAGVPSLQFARASEGALRRLRGRTSPAHVGRVAAECFSGVLGRRRLLGGVTTAGDEPERDVGRWLVHLWALGPSHLRRSRASHGGRGDVT
jgi:hypothetical protein